jgi:hypothetical protein
MITGKSLTASLSEDEETPEQFGRDSHTQFDELSMV